MNSQSGINSCLGWVLLVGCFLMAGCSHSKRPNIVVLIADDMYWAGLSIQMHPELEPSANKEANTPYLASLAETGMRFSSAYSASPVSAVSLQSIATGKSSVHQKTTRESQQPTLIDRLRSAGYRVASSIDDLSGKRPFYLQESIPSGTVDQVDQKVGETLDRIKAIGAIDSTYIIFTASSGAPAGPVESPLLSGGSEEQLLEASIRVPLIIRGPGVASSSWSEQRVIGFDLYPTLCQLARVLDDVSVELDGGSIVHLLNGGTSMVERRAEALVFHLSEPPKSAILMGDHKLIRNETDQSIQVYDLHRDISEQKDLSAQTSEFSERMLKRMDEMLQN